MVLVVLSGFATTVPLVMFAGAARRVPFTMLGPMQYIVPTINFLLGVFVYHETLERVAAARLRAGLDRSGHLHRRQRAGRSGRSGHAGPAGGG